MNHLKITNIPRITFFLFFFILSAGNTCPAQQTNKKTKDHGTSENIPVTKEMQAAMTPSQALQRLKDGNQRYVSGHIIKRDLRKEMSETSKGQYPFAVILSCIDSRTSSELIFDQGLGDVFNARIAGNFVNTDILGSMEFACKVAGAKLILVNGHTQCGAVKSACDHVEMGNITHLMKEIEPAVDSVKDISGERNSHNAAFVREVTLMNIKLALNEIREKSEILWEMERKGEIILAGSLYDLNTGKVEFIQ